MGIELKTYERFIDPLLRKVHSETSALLPENIAVMDIACGNGTLALMHAERGRNVLGIDISEEMLHQAKKRAENKKLTNVVFKVGDANKLETIVNDTVDAATISMAVHQFEVEEAITLLKSAGRLAKEIVIADYACPLPWGFNGILTRIIERLAGKEHHRNFRHYLKLGGLPAICRAANLKIIIENHYNSVFQVIKCVSALPKSHPGANQYMQGKY